MADRDSAFLWETEALRSFPRPTSRLGDSPSPDRGAWLTLREASRATGVPIDTIRKWARHGNIPSYLEDSNDGKLRMVSLEGINRWADKLDRDIEDHETATASEVDLTSEEFQEPEEDASTRGGRSPEPDIPEGTMLVPLDAWNKMLNQLGNLHEAGQELAEARERAAKAETESTFLKERLSEMRAELEKTRTAVADASEPEEPEEKSGPSGTDPDLSVSRFTKAKARQLYDRWRDRRR